MQPVTDARRSAQARSNSLLSRHSDQCRIPTVIAALIVFALSASAAIYLILELSQPFSGLMHISSAPLRNALAPLGP